MPSKCGEKARCYGDINIRATFENPHTKISQLTNGKKMFFFNKIKKILTR